MPPTDAREVWDAFAREDAYYYVLTVPEKAGRRWSTEEFLATGRRDVANLLSLVEWPEGFTAGTCVDLGCGVGRLSLALADRFQRVIGVDVSGTMLENAERLASSRGIRNVEFVLGDGTSLAPLPDTSVDCCFSSVTLQHVATSEGVLAYVREFHRILKPHGVAVFHLPLVPPGLKYGAKHLASRLLGQVRGRLTLQRLSKDVPAYRGCRTRVADLERVLDAFSHKKLVLTPFHPERKNPWDAYASTVVTCRK